MSGMAGGTVLTTRPISRRYSRLNYFYSFFELAEIIRYIEKSSY